MVLKTRKIIAILGCLACVELISGVCWADNVAYVDQDVVPGAGPCEQCICNAPDIVCSMIKCAIKVGCKIIQRPNQCCPDYKCDCEYNGQVYNNGAKIDTSDTPCRVCYCKGGDVMCTAVGCYERADCEGKIVPGTCCPKYDHCPPLNVNGTKNRVKLTTTNTVTLRNGKRGLQPWLLTTDATNTDPPDDSSTLDTYATESTALPEKALTMIMKRIPSAETVPPDEDHRIASTDAYSDETGISAASEAVNTVKTSTKVVTANGSLAEDIVVPYRKRPDSSATNGSTKCPSTGPNSPDDIITIAYTDETTPDDPPERLQDVREVTRAAQAAEDVTADTESTTPEVAATEAKIGDRLVVGAQLRVRTTVKLVDNETASDDEQPAGVRLIENGSNLTRILSDGVLSDSTTTEEEQKSVTTLKADVSSSNDGRVESLKSTTQSGSETDHGSTMEPTRVVNSTNSISRTAEFAGWTTTSASASPTDESNVSDDGNRPSVIENVKLADRGNGSTSSSQSSEFGPPDVTLSPVNEINLAGVTTESDTAAGSDSVELENIRVASSNVGSANSSESVEDSDESGESDDTQAVVDLSVSNQPVQITFTTQPPSIDTETTTVNISRSTLGLTTTPSSSPETLNSQAAGQNKSKTVASISPISETVSASTQASGNDLAVPSASPSAVPKPVTGVVEDVIIPTRFTYENDSSAYPSFKNNFENNGRSNVVLASGFTPSSERTASRLTANKTILTDSVSSNSTNLTPSGSQCTEAANCTNRLRSTLATASVNSSGIGQSAENETYSTTIVIEFVTSSSAADANRNGNFTNIDASTGPTTPNVWSAENITQAGGSSSMAVSTNEEVTKFDKLRVENVTEAGQTAGTVTTESAGILTVGKPATSTATDLQTNAIINSISASSDVTVDPGTASSSALTNCTGLSPHSQIESTIPTNPAEDLHPNSTSPLTYSQSESTTLTNPASDLHPNSTDPQTHSQSESTTLTNSIADLHSVANASTDLNSTPSAPSMKPANIDNSTVGVSNPASGVDQVALSPSIAESNFTEIYAHKFVVHPVKLINSVNSVYLSPGLGIRERPSISPPPANVTSPPPTNVTSPPPVNATSPPPADASSPPPVNAISPPPANATSPPPANTTSPPPANATSPPATSVASNSTRAVGESNAAEIASAKPEDSKAISASWLNASSAVYKILLDGSVKPLTRPPNSTMAPLSWLKGSFPAPATAASTTPRVSAAIVSSSVPLNATVSAVPSVEAAADMNMTAARVDATKNESREEPAQAKVYDPLMPYPEEYPEEYQTIQNGPAIIITRTTYTRIPDVTYTTVTMATLPTYQQVQKAEEGFAETLFDRKFHERSFAELAASTTESGAPAGSYFNIDVKKIEEATPSPSKSVKSRKGGLKEEAGDVVQASRSDEDVPMLDEKDMKMVQNFMNKNMKL